MKYSLDLINRMTITIEADSRVEAIRLAKALHQFHKVEYISDEDKNSSVVDFCEGCGSPIFRYDEENTHDIRDENGNFFCNNCVDVSKL